MQTNFEKVAAFMEVFGQDVHTVPRLPSPNILKLRMDLIREEVQELEQGYNDGDLVAIADALTDILYVVYGMGHSLGIDLDKCFSHIHSSNMSKLDSNGNPIYREDGKVMKGPDYWPPDLEKILF